MTTKAKTPGDEATELRETPALAGGRAKLSSLAEVVVRLRELPLDDAIEAARRDGVRKVPVGPGSLLSA